MKSTFKRYSNPIAPIPAKVWQDPFYFIAFGFGAGAMPVAPGTFGTLMAIPFYLLFSSLPLFYYIGFVLLLIVATSFLCERISKEIQTHDHQGMCIDEFVGFFVTMIGSPTEFRWIIIGFVLFRLFDIWKPQPIRYIDEHVHGGFGMILDDVIAGIFAMGAMQLLNVALHYFNLQTP